uniref:Uncharacterized protein n=1 Tax=Sphaerodactylus townsendi TaxID=933632 RepID=A0ACB8G2P4_9SAUR
MGSLKEELLKPIWHAFTALDVDKSGKVSKSQLKATQRNPVYTVFLCLNEKREEVWIVFGLKGGGAGFCPVIL